jgi:hypothetical protein
MGFTTTSTAHLTIQVQPTIRSIQPPVLIVREERMSVPASSYFKSNQLTLHGTPHPLSSREYVILIVH